MSAVELTDEVFLDAIREAMRLREIEDETQQAWATRWDVAAVLAGHPEDVAGSPVSYPKLPEAIVIAKAADLIERGVISGCACACRGDFMIVGEEYWRA